MSVNLETAFKEVVENIFNRWSALRLVVEHGMGGRNGHQTAIEIMNYMIEYCLKNPEVTVSDVEECLDEIMDQEFETICEDNSIKEISFLLVKYLNMCREGNITEIEAEFAKLPTMSKWIYPGAKIKYVAVQDSDDSSEDQGDEMEFDDNGVNSKGHTKSEVPVEEDGEPGWTTVRSSRRNKK